MKNYLRAMAWLYLVGPLSVISFVCFASVKDIWSAIAASIVYTIGNGSFILAHKLVSKAF